MYIYIYDVCVCGHQRDDLVRGVRRLNIDTVETVQLLEESGFGFLPETDLQNQPLMETVMSVGLRLCALEYTAKQLNILAYLSMSGLLPVTFPHERWVLAVQRSFFTQEVAVCSNQKKWEEIRQILEVVQTATVTDCRTLGGYHLMDQG